jgi:hypothetical protein
MGDVSGLAAKQIEGAAAHDAPVVDNPLLGGGEARTTLPTAVGDGDAVRAMHDDLGRRVTSPHASRDLTVDQQTTITDTTETTILAAGAAGVFRDLVHIIVSNDDNNNEATVTFRDDTGGTVKLKQAAARSGGGYSLEFPRPLKQGTAARVWTAQLDVATTSIHITVIAVENN